jgi:hypothetical protein
MTKLPFAGATALITIKKNCCPYPSMSSCAASSCMSFPKALSASATLASSPTGGAPLSFRSVFNYSEQYRHRRPNQKPPLPRNPAHFGSVPNVAEGWGSSRDLPPPRSNSALHPLSPVSPHDTTIPISLTRCLSPPTGVVRPDCPQITYPLPTSPQTFAPTPAKYNQIHPPCPHSSLHYLFSKSFCPQHHSICITAYPWAASFKQLYRTRPAQRGVPTCAL